MKEVKPTSWYKLIRDGLENSTLAQEPIDGGRRFSKAGEAPLPQHDAATPGVATAPPEPAWLRQRVARDPAPRLLRPSDADDAAATSAAFSGEGADARRRGVVVHRLLQSLPDIAPDKRAGAAQRFLARNVADWPADARDELAQRTLGLIDKFGDLFGPNSRAEVPMVGRLTLGTGERVGVSGQIDRLVVGERDVLIADFKTNRAVPKSESQVPPAYRRQLALYRALLAKLYPQLTIRAALVWTETPEMMELSQAALDAELARITSS
jgi:ATP-dependent helicase/nuclease subunit A